jgi:large subunit ribosomal protein L9
MCQSAAGANRAVPDFAEARYLAHGADINRSHVTLNTPIKSIGQYKVPLALHPEVEVAITIIVARSAAEAERIARGEDVTVRREEAEEEAAAVLANAEAFFEPDAAKALHAGEGAGDAGEAKATADAEAPAKAVGKAKKKDEEV